MNEVLTKRIIKSLEKINKSINLLNKKIVGNAKKDYIVTVFESLQACLRRRILKNI